jgi:gluconolactonase
VVSRDGIIWFTDPPYGIIVEIEGHPGVKEYEDCFVFAFDPKTQKLRPVVTDVEEPNGLAFSPDESILYVADTSVLFKATGNHHIRAYDMQDGRAKNGRTLIDIQEGVIDGFRVDKEGNLWCSSEIGVQIFTPAGVHIGTIPTPEKVGNLAFGGDEGTDLFIAANTSLYHIKTSTQDAAKHY